MVGELVPVPVDPAAAGRDFWRRYHAFRRARQEAARPDDPLQSDEEEEALMKRAEEGILRSGVPIGGVARTAEQANAMIDRGYLALALGFDWSLFQRGIAAAFQGIKR